MGFSLFVGRVKSGKRLSVSKYSFVVIKGFGTQHYEQAYELTGMKTTTDDSLIWNEKNLNLL